MTSWARVARNTAGWLGACLAFSMAGCFAPGAKDSGPTLLLGGIRSRIRPDEARRAFDAENKWRILDERVRESADGRKGPKTVRAWIEPYSDLGSDGAIVLWFFNDELASVQFFPNDMDKYLLALRDQRGLDLTQRGELRLPPGTLVMKGVTATKQAYVSWEDDAIATAMRRAAS